MLTRHYLVVALANVRRAPHATAVNLLTLAAGLFCFLTAYAFVAFWNSAERHFPNADRIHVLTTAMAPTTGGWASAAGAGSALRAAEHLRIDFPELERVARATVIDRQTAVSTAGDVRRVFAIAADPEFLETFALPFLAGDPLRALDTPRSVVLTTETAERLFGGQNPIGRSVLIENRVDVTVTGVIDAVPEPSHFGRSASASLPFELLASHDVRDALRAVDGDDSPNAPEGIDWLSTPARTYLLLPGDGSLTAATLEARLRNFAERHISAEVRAIFDFELGLMPVTDLLRNSVDSELFLDDRAVSVSTVLLVLGGLVLAVACVNYANLATASAARRVREAGLRKALGARPSHLRVQHLFEAALLSVAALLVALVTFRAASPMLEALIGVDPADTLFAGTSVWVFLLLAVAAVTLAAGAYPAFVVSRVLAMDAIRGTRLRIGPGRLAMVLVGLQFAVASFLLIAVLVIWMQNDELRRTGLGRTSDPLLVIENASGRSGVDTQTLRAELSRVAGVRGVTETGYSPWISMSANAYSAVPDGTSPAVMVMTRGVGRDFFSVFDVELLAGRALDPDRAEDLPFVFDEGQPPPERPLNAVVDRAFVERFGFESPAAAVGQLVYSPSLSPESRAQPFRIVGVAETIRWIFSSVAGATSTLYRLEDEQPVTVVRIAADDVAGTLERVDALWQRLAPNVPIDRRFLDEIFEQVYRTYARINQVFVVLALIAFLISTAGLVGMATLVAGRRRREVAVRKTHGARTREMVLMLLASFAKPVVAANLIAWPVAYLAARAYLDMHLHPIPLTPLPFALCLAFTLAITFAAVAGQTLRTARTMPAEVLRHE